MDKATILWGAGILLTIIAAFGIALWRTLNAADDLSFKQIEINVNDIKEIKKEFATKKEVKEVKTDLNDKINRLMDMQNEANKLLHEILLKVGVDHEK